MACSSEAAKWGGLGLLILCTVQSKSTMYITGLFSLNQLVEETRVPKCNLCVEAS